MEAKFYEPKYKDGKILAFADIDLAEGITIRGFRVINGAKGLFAALVHNSRSRSTIVLYSRIRGSP